ncbi:hypothetical protein [Serpentinicella alkaliphila]|uniref:hypothetical protein n=1 Tax=Serpentinicella alkaliphila TaxID=1734049 RepID=UPI0014046635|nr:hypothetical protein [Serpentinicella alkaliphila]QUH24484.1 hypothetical protein HZR23_00845 [Serpentinicella alkaliphila]
MTPYKKKLFRKNSEIIQSFTNAIYKAMLLVEELSAEEIAKSLATTLPRCIPRNFD